AGHLPPGGKEGAVLTVTAILVSFNSAAVIGAALASLPPGMPAIVVDNASSDDSAAIAEAAGATVIRNARNLGFGVANNIGMRAAATEWVLLLNPDATLQPGFMGAMAAAATPETAVLVPAITTSKGRFAKHHSVLTPAAFRPAEMAPGVRRIGFASGGVMLARRNALLDLGGFDEAIFLYFEDDDLSRRVLDAGRNILLVEAAEAMHAGNVSTPPSPDLTYLKHWHMAWSERHVRLKHGLTAPGYWRVAESSAKMLWAQIRRDGMEEAKQLGLINGTLGHMRGMRAQDVRDTLRMERE
ncbi:MAG: glycosyltransferase family 2 protein, partial [Beijerinckiaceae bacterium]